MKNLFMRTACLLICLASFEAQASDNSITFLLDGAYKVERGFSGWARYLYSDPLKPKQVTSWLEEVASKMKIGESADVTLELRTRGQGTVNFVLEKSKSGTVLSRQMHNAYNGEAIPGLIEKTTIKDFPKYLKKYGHVTQDIEQLGVKVEKSALSKRFLSVLEELPSAGRLAAVGASLEKGFIHAGPLLNIAGFALFGADLHSHGIAAQKAGHSYSDGLADSLIEMGTFAVPNYTETQAAVATGLQKVAMDPSVQGSWLAGHANSAQRNPLIKTAPSESEVEALLSSSAQ